jgi:hypothetical protein
LFHLQVSETVAGKECAIEAGAVPLVAERLDDPSSEVRRFGAGTLMTMAIAESGKRAMSHPSVLPKLAALMTDPDPFVEVRYFT